MGTTYSNVIRREGMNAMLKKVMKRAGLLYLLTVGLTIVFALLWAISSTVRGRER
jgi:hypothetical protein